MTLKEAIKEITRLITRIDFEEHFKWFTHKFDLIDKSKELDNNRKNNLHPLRPRKGEIYLIEFGKNVGKELSNTHMGIIMQNSLKNSISSTIVVIPISSSAKLYDSHEKIEINDILIGKLDKLPSKAKTEQITCVDKSRLVHKVGELTPEFMIRLEERLLKNLDIKNRE